MSTSPSAVNFTALEPRLSSTCWILTASPMQRRRDVGMDVDKQLDALAVRGRREDASDVVDDAGTLRAVSSMSSLPASILEKSRMSLMMTSRFSADTLTPEASSRWSVSRAVSSSSSVSPITPFIGVRISWLIVERKSDLAFDAISAPSRAAGQILGRLARLGHVAAVENVAADRWVVRAGSWRSTRSCATRRCDAACGLERRRLGVAASEFAQVVAQ